MQMFKSPSLLELLPEKVVLQFEAARLIELQQYLSCLGYVGDAGMEDFRTELEDLMRADPEAAQSLLDGSPWGLEKGSAGEAASRDELHCLRMLCSLEGQFKCSCAVHSWPVLVMRVLRHRLCELQLWEGRSLDQATLERHLDRLGALLGEVEVGERMACLGDLQLLFQALRPLVPIVLFVQTQSRKRGTSELAQDSGKVFWEGLKETAPPAEVADFEHQILKPSKSKRGRAQMLNYVETAMGDPRQHLLLQVLHLRLRGHAWKGEARNISLPELLQDKFQTGFLFTGEQSRQEAAREQAMVQVGQGYWALNGQKLWELSEMQSQPSRQQTAKGPPKLLKWLREKGGDPEKALGQLKQHANQSPLAMFEFLQHNFMELDRILDLLVGRSSRTLLYGQAQIRMEYTAGFGLIQTIEGELSWEVLERHGRYLDHLEATLEGAASWLGELLVWGKQVVKGPMGWVELGVRLGKLLGRKASTSVDDLFSSR